MHTDQSFLECDKVEEVGGHQTDEEDEGEGEEEDRDSPVFGKKTKRVWQTYNVNCHTL